MKNEIDRDSTDKYKSLLQVQYSIFEKLKSYTFDLSKTEITDAIIERMDAFWHFNINNKELLERRTNSVAADFFTETCLLFIKAYFENKHNGIYKVYSEEQIKTDPNNKRKHIKPDISIKKNNKLVAAIEIKISNSFKRKSIDAHLKDRELQIKTFYPNAYFGVIAFWNFFNTNSEE